MRTAVNVVASCVLFFTVGSFYATGVFNSAIDEEVPPDSKLRGRWATGMGFLTLLTAPVMVGSALYLNAGEFVPVGIKTRRVKALGGIGALSFLGFALAATGVRQNQPTSLTLGVVLLGIPLGVFYFLCTELLGAWLPKHRGLAVGCGQAAFGLGTIVFSAVFDELVHHFGACAAITIAGFLLGFPAMVAAAVSSWPANCYSDDVECGKSESECDSFLSNLDEQPGSEVVPIKTLFRDISFWQYLIVVFCSQAGFAMVPFFFEMGTAYNLSTTNTIVLFQVCNALGTVARLGGGVISDVLAGSNGLGGARKLMILLLGVQSLGFLVLAVGSKADVVVFSACAIMLFISFSGGACACALLARDLFGNTNSGTVFAVGGGLAIGLAESGASQMVATTLSHPAFNTGTSKFTIAFSVLTVTSVIGLLGAMMSRHSSYAFPHQKSSLASMTNHDASLISYDSIR